jgi:hypothetical protein
VHRPEIGSKPTDPLLSPLALVVGFGSQLGKFAAIEAHVASLANAAERSTWVTSTEAPLSPSGRGDPS